MKTRWLNLFCCAGLLAGCATHPPENRPITINTDQHSPVRIHIYEERTPEEAAKADTVLLLPPLGIKDPQTRNHFHELFYRTALRRFSAPVMEIPADSAYAPYIDSKNLILNDGTLNYKEIAIIGNLMGANYVICPQAYEIRPYPPQRIDLRILVINAQTDLICAEMFAVFDANDRDVVEYFNQFCQSNKEKPEEDEDLDFRLKSPTAFQTFAIDLCSTVLAQKLTF